MRRLQIPLMFSFLGFVSFADAGEKKESDKVPKNLKITINTPKDPPTLAEVNSGRYAITLTIENTGKEDVVLWPYLSVEVMDSKGKPVERSRFIGRWGLLSTPSIIEAVPFVNLGAGKTRKIEVKLNAHQWDADAITGWRLPAAGDYVVVLHYHYDRAAAKKSYGKGCDDIDKKNAQWNRALEVDKKAEVKLTVK